MTKPANICCILKNNIKPLIKDTNGRQVLRKDSLSHGCCAVRKTARSYQNIVCLRTEVLFIRRATKISDSCDSIKKYLRLYRCIHILRPLNSYQTWIYSFPLHSYYKKYYTEEKKIVYTKSTSKFFMKRNGYVGRLQIEARFNRCLLHFTRAQQNESMHLIVVCMHACIFFLSLSPILRRFNLAT